MERRCFMNIEKLARKVEKHLESHGAAVEVKEYNVIHDGWYILRLKLKRGTKERRVFDCASDIKTAFGYHLFQPFKEGLDLFIAVSERPVMVNSLKNILESQMFQEISRRIPYAIGYKVTGGMVIADLFRLTHLLIAGSSSWGKSVALQSLITSIVVSRSVDEVNLLLIDVGADSMRLFSKVPHLSHPIVKDAETGVKVLLALVKEMDKRMILTPKAKQNLPYIICVIDEFVSLISNIWDKKVARILTEAVSDLLRRGRQARIHMVLATQDPTKNSTKVDLGNITARIAFRCAKSHDSVSILGVGGAEKLTSKGSMLFKSPEHAEPLYLQGSYMQPGEIKCLIRDVFLHYKGFTNTSHNNKFVISETVVSEPTQTLDLRIPEVNKELADIILWVLGRKSVSVLQIMKHFRMGNRAVDIVQELFQMNLIADKFANLPRDVVPQQVDDLSDKARMILSENGISEDDIEGIINSRS
jgi:S-DNA-T family DNA segregation ATPase FtsK/SpoIIIE